MKPKKRILLACADEDSASVMKFTLEVNGFAAWIAPTAEAALVLLGQRFFDVLVCELPFAAAEDVLDGVAKGWYKAATVIVDRAATAAPADLAADIFIGKSDFTFAILLDRVKTGAARLRGPGSRARGKLPALRSSCSGAAVALRRTA
jgi:DNA-binding response OmpR family regulator